MKCTFQAADFLNLPDVAPVDVAYAIEAFVHAADPARFFQQIGSQLSPGGKLVLVDDGLSERGATPERLSKQERQWLADFRAGWLAQSLISIEEAKQFAREAGLKLVSVDDLTPIMDIGRPRDQLIGLMIRIAGPWMRRSNYFKSLTGGYAKQQLLKKGVVRYQKLVFRKES
ncbi:MAG: methyltransferase domain-containing protein [Bacteroidota bacterium]